MINERGIKVPQGHLFFIEKVFYMSDEGGICCRITLPNDLKEDFIVSITHLSINQSSSLGKQIKRYQKRLPKGIFKKKLNRNCLFSICADFIGPTGRTDEIDYAVKI